MEFNVQPAAQGHLRKSNSVIQLQALVYDILPPRVKIPEIYVRSVLRHIH